MTNGLSGDLSSIEGSAVGVVARTWEARAIRLTIAAGGAVGVGGTGGNADSGGDVAESLVGPLASVVVAIGVDGAGLANSVGHAIVSLSVSAVAVASAGVDAEASDQITVRLVGGFTSVEGSAGGDAGAADAEQVGLTIVTAGGGGLTRQVVRAHERGDADSEGGVAFRLSGLRTSIEGSAVRIG